MLKPEKFKQLGTLFTSTFFISAFTFGGGYVILPLMRKKFVDQLHWMDEDEMLDLMSIAQSSPGAMAVNIAVLVGYRLAGIAGVMVSIVGTILPPLIILTLISMGYEAFSTNTAIALILRGMRAGVAAIIFDVVITLFMTIGKDGKIVPFLVAAAAFALTTWLNVNVALIILASGLAGVAGEFWRRGREGTGK